MLTYSGAFQSDLAKDAHAQAYHAGQRDVGLFLLGLLDCLDDDILASMREDSRRRHKEAEIREEKQEKENAQLGFYDLPNELDE